MNIKVAVGVVAVVVIGAVLLVWYQRTHQPIPTEPLKSEFTWSFIDLGVDATSSMPKTDVSLAVAGVPALHLGVFDGNCFAIAGSRWPLLPSEVSGAICYFAGGGKEIGVFEEGGSLVLKQGDVDEGDAEHPGTRANFVPLSPQPKLQ